MSLLVRRTSVCSRYTGTLRATFTVSYARKYTSSYLIDFHSLSTNTLSRQQPLPSILILMSLSLSSCVNSRLVNWQP